MPLSFLFFSGCIVTDRLAKMAIPALGLLAILFCYKTVSETQRWIRVNAEYLRIEVAGKLMPEGSLLIAASDPDDPQDPNRPWWHSASIAALDQENFQRAVIQRRALAAPMGTTCL